MRILFFSDNFPPEVNASANRTYEHCREWVKLGHEVTVITSVPNFPQGRVHDGYRNRFRRQIEFVDGIRVVRIWTWIAANEGVLKRIIDQLSYLFSSVVASLKESKPDVIVGTSPQFFATCAAYLSSLFHRRPYVFELRDIWPASIRAVGAMKPNKFLDFMEKIEIFLYQRADHIVSVTNSFRDELESRGIDPGKISVTTNGVDTKRFSKAEPDASLESRLGVQGKFVVGYIGTIGMAHGLAVIPQAATLLRERGFANKVAFLVTGDGAEREKLKALCKSAGTQDMVIFQDPVSREDVADYWAVADAALVHLVDQPLFETVIPSKIFEAMAMECPILHGVRGESAHIVRSSGAGLTFAPEDPEQLADGILQLLENSEMREAMSRAGRKASESYSREALAKGMAAELEKIVADDRKTISPS